MPGRAKGLLRAWASPCLQDLRGLGEMKAVHIGPTPNIVGPAESKGNCLRSFAAGAC